MFPTSTTREFARMSDNGQDQVLRETHFRAALALLLSPIQLTVDPQSLQASTMSASPEVTYNYIQSYSSEQVGRELFSSLLPRLRMLRAVVDRLPRHFAPYKHLPEYKLTYYVETLSCGHSRTYYPQAGPMAKRRFCSECAKSSKKPCNSVSDKALAAKQGA